MSTKQPPWAFGVVFPYRGKPAKAVFLERSKADSYAADHHGILYGLYTEDQLTESPAEMKICPNQTSLPSSIINEDNFSVSDETAT